MATKKTSPKPRVSLQKKHAEVKKNLETINKLTKKNHQLRKEAAKLDRAALKQKLTAGQPIEPSRSRRSKPSLSKTVGRRFGFVAQAAAAGSGNEPGLWQKLVLVCLRSLKQGTPLDPLVPGMELSKQADLQDYVDAEEEMLDSVDLHNGAYAALQGAAKQLAAAHAQAAAVQVNDIGPKDPGSADILEDLKILSAAIKGDQNFSSTLNALEAAAVAYGG